MIHKIWSDDLYEGVEDTLRLLEVTWAARVIGVGYKNRVSI